MSGNEIEIVLARHDSYLDRVAEMLGYVKMGRDIPRELRLDENELSNLDSSLGILAERLLKNPGSSETLWLGPVMFANKSSNKNPHDWLEALHRGLRQSRAFFQVMDIDKSRVNNVNNYNVTIKGVVGPVNVLSSLDNVVQAINKSPSLSSTSKETFSALVCELKAALISAPAKHADDAELISEQAEAVAEELKKPAPRASALKIKAAGLIEAAKALEAVVPTAIAVAKKIAEFVTNPIA